MLKILGLRQQELLNLLLKNKSGLTVDELSKRLGIAKNAVRQHLSSLENDDFVAQGISRPSGGRPEQLYILSDAGKELFPRHYSWFAQLIVESIKQESGEDGLKERMNAMGVAVAKQLKRQYPDLDTLQNKIEKLSEIMEELGYDTKNTSTLAGRQIIEADNCIFHNLAIKNPAVCEFDLALMANFTDSHIDHQECMANKGNICRFKFKSGA